MFRFEKTGDPFINQVQADDRQQRQVDQSTNHLGPAITKGEPFVGRAGQLLTKIIAACRLAREEVYILNVLKCRPPGNRNPLPEEALNCRPFLDRQLALIQPEFVCCLGAVAAQSLLNTTASIGKLRGTIHHYQGIQVVCTYHPAYLLRNPAAKGNTWNDIKMLMRAMDVDLS